MARATARAGRASSRTGSRGAAERGYDFIFGMIALAIIAGPGPSGAAAPAGAGGHGGRSRGARIATRWTREERRHQLAGICIVFWAKPMYWLNLGKRTQ